MSNINIVGIDPGLAHCGWGVLALPRGPQARLRLLACGEIRTTSCQDLAGRLREIHKQLQDIFSLHRPQACAVEKLYFNKNCSSALPVAHARGVALLCAAQHEVPVFEFSANLIKQAVTGNGKATKQQVQEMVGLLLGLRAEVHGASDDAGQVKRSDHAADALAAAICLVHQRGLSDASVNGADQHLLRDMAAWRLEKEARSRAYDNGHFARLLNQALQAQDKKPHTKNGKQTN